EIGHSLGKEDRSRLLRFVQVRDLMELARRAGSAVLTNSPLPPCPELDLANLYVVPDQGNGNISRSQSELREWEKRYRSDWQYLRWPASFTSDNANFTQLWREKFSPLRKWIKAAAGCVAAEVQHRFLEFRLERGLVTY